MRAIQTILFLFLCTLVFTSCEEEYIPASTGESQKFVVEGYLEAGEDPLPPYILLTRTFDFYSELGPDQFSDAFVHDADVRVSDGTLEVIFEEVCFLDLPPEVREVIAGEFGFNADSLQVNFCVYIDLLNQLQPQIGK